MYTVILKIKEGELIALQQNEPAVNTRVILEALQTPPGVRIQKQLHRVIAAAKEQASIGVDYHAQQSRHIESFEQLLTTIPQEDRSKIAPVLHLGSGKNAFKSALAHADQHSEFFYLRAKVLTHHAQPAEQAYDLIKSMGFEVDRVRLIVDFGDIEERDAYEDWFGEVGARSVIHSPFADVSIAATSYPGSVSKYTTGWTKFSRHEMQVWQANALKNAPTLRFADYGCRSTAFPPPPVKFPLPVLAQLRYTLGDEYLVFRGALLKKDRNQHYRIGYDLVNRSEFFGADFSWGDLNLDFLAQGQGGPRGRSQMIAYETAHHVQATEALLAQRFGP